MTEKGKKVHYIKLEDNVYTRTKEFYGPNYTGKIELISGTAKKTGTTGSANRNLGRNIASTRRHREVDPEDRLTLVHVQGAIDYVTSILGDSYVREFLGFKNYSDIKEENGRRLLGYTEGFNMVLATIGDNIVTKQAFTHEPVHIIIDHIMSEKERKKLYNAIKSYTGNKEMSTDDAWEWIAGMHEKDVVFKAKDEPTTIIGKALEFLKRLFFSMKKDYEHLNEFFRNIDSGFYKDKIDVDSGPRFEGRRYREEKSEEYQLNNRKFILLANDFGDRSYLDAASNLVIRNVKDFSSASNYLDGPIGSFKDSIENVRNDFKRIAEERDLAKKFEGVKTPEEAVTTYRMRASSYELGISDDIIRHLWVVHNIAKDNNYDIIVKKIFPNASLTTDENRKELSRAYQESSTVDPEKFTSDVIKNFLRSIPYHEFDNVGRVLPEDTAMEFVDHDLIKAEVADSFHTVAPDGVITQDVFQRVFADLKKKADSLNTGQDTDNISRNMILSFLEYYGKVKSEVELVDDLKASYEVFAGDRDPSEAPAFSHNQFANHGEDVFAMMDAAGIADMNFTDLIRQRISASQELLNAIMTSLNQYRVDYYTLQASRWRGTLEFRKNIYRETSAARMKRDIRGRMNNKFYSGDGGVSDEGYQAVSNRYGINVSDKEVKYTTFGTVLRYRNNNWEWATNNEQTQVDVLKGLLRGMGIFGVKDSTVFNLIHNKEIRDRYNITPGDIANYIGNMLLSVKNGYQEVYKEEVNDRLVLFLRNVVRYEVDFGELPKIDDFFPFVDMLADVQAFVTGKISPFISMSVHGKAKSNMVLPNSLKDTFHYSEALGHKAGVVGRAVTARDSMTQHEKNMSNLTLTIDGEEFFTNPLFETKGDYIFAVDNFDLVNGIQDRYFSKEPNDFVEADYTDMAIYGLFKDSIFNGDGAVINLLPENMGDSSVLPYFGVVFDAGRARLAKIVTVEGKKQLMLDNDLINHYIDYGFKKAYKSRLTSLYRLANYFNNVLNDKVADIDKEVPVEEQAGKLLSALKTMRRKLETDPRPIDELMADLKHNGLWENNDFRIKKGKVTVGYDADMVDDIYNARNHGLWESAKTSADKTKIRRSIFNNRLKRFTDSVRKDTGPIPEGISDFGSKYYTTEEKVLVRRRKKSISLRIRNYHPYYEAFYYADHIAKKFLLSPVLGSEHQFKDAIQKSKRNKLGNSSGYKPVLGGRGLPRKAYFVTLTDRSDTRDYGLLKAFTGNGEYLDHESAELLNPVYHNQTVSSLGGEAGMAEYSDTTIKSVVSGTDPSMDRANQYKYAQFKLTEDQIMNTKGGWDLWHFLLTRDTSQVNMYEEYMKQIAMGKSHDEAVVHLQDLVADHPEYADAMYAGVNFESGNPSNDARVNDIPLEELPFYDDVVENVRDNGQVYYQLNLNSQGQRDIARANQLETQIILGKGDSEHRASLIDRINQTIYQKLSQRIYEDIAKYGVEDYLNRLGLQSSDLMGKITLTGELYAAGITSSLPILHDTAMQALVNKINKAINPRNNGVLAVQTPADFDLIEAKDEHGNTYYTTFDSIENDTWEGLKTRKLQHLRLIDENGKEIEFSEEYHKDLDELKKQIDYANAYLKKYGENEETLNYVEGKIIDRDLVSRVKEARDEAFSRAISVKPGEIATEYPYRAEFGIEKNETLDQVLTIKVDGKKLNVRAWFKNEMGKAGLDYYNRQDRRGFADKFIEFLSDKKVDAREMTAPEDVARYYIPFLDTLITHSERIPTSGFASASVDEIVMFTPNSGNRVYISSERNALSNADYDIDELHVYFKKPIKSDKSGRPLVLFPKDPDNSSGYYAMDISALENLKHELIVDTLSDIANIKELLSPVTVGELRNFVKPTNSYHADFTSTKENFIATKEGKRMVSRFANAIHSYASFLRVNPEVRERLGISEARLRESIPSYDILRGEVETIANNLFKSLQASVDNPKEMILGYLNINEVSGNVVTAMILNGMPMKDIVDLLTSDIVGGTIREVLNSHAVRNSQKNLLDAIDEKINILRSRFVDVDQKEGVREYENRLKYIIEKKLAQKDEDIADKIEFKESDFDPYTFSSDELEQGVEAIREEYKNTAEEERADYLDKEIEKLKESLAKSEEITKSYNESMKKMAQKGIQDLMFVKEMYYKGQFVFRFSTGLSLYTGLPATSWDRYIFTKRMEKTLGQSLEDFMKGKKNYDGWRAHADRLPGGDVEHFSFPSGKAINKYAKDFVAALRSRIRDKGKVRFITSGDEGFNSALIKNLTGSTPDDNFSVEVYTTADGTVLNGNGRRVHLTGDNLVKGEARGSRSLKYELAKKGDVSIHIDATTGNVDRVNIAGKSVTFRADKRDVKNGFKDIIDEIVKKANESDEPITVSLTGSDEFTLKTQPLTQRERYLDEETNIRKYGNIADLYHEMPDIEAYMGAMFLVNKVDSRVWFNSPHIQKLRDEITEMNAKEWMNTNEFIAFSSAVSDVMMGMYYNDSKFEFDFSDYFPESEVNIDLSKDVDRNYFLYLLPEIVKRIQNDAANDLSKNLFLQKLSISNGVLIFDRSFSEKDDTLKQAFHEIAQYEGGKQLQEALTHYEFMYRGFKGLSHGSWRNYIDPSFYKDLSGYIDATKDDFMRAGDVVSNLNANFITNAFNKYHELVRFHDEQNDPWISEGIHPQYIRTYERLLNRRSREVIKRWDPVTEQYVKVDYAGAKSLAIMPVDKTMETEWEVVRLNDVRQFEQMFSDNKVINKFFEQDHSYPSTMDVVVGDYYGKLTKTGPKSIRINLNENPGLNRNLESKRRIAQASTEDFVKALDLRDVDGEPLEMFSNDLLSNFTRMNNKALEYNSKKLFLKNPMKNLGAINGVILRMGDKELFNEATDMAEKYGFTRPGMSDEEAVGKLIANVTPAVKEGKDLEKLKEIRHVVANHILYSLSKDLYADAQVMDMLNKGASIAQILRAKAKEIKDSDQGLYHRIMNFWEQRKSDVDKISDDTAQHLMEKARKQFGVEGTVIDASLAAEMLGTENVPVAFSYDGHTYLVAGRAHADTPLHEALHPVMDALERSNNTLYKGLSSDLLTTNRGKAVYQEVRERYPSLSDEDIMKEALVTYIGRYASSEWSVPAKDKSLLKRLWEAVKSIFQKMTSVDVSDIRPDMTLEEFTDKIARGDKITFDRIEEGKVWEQKKEIKDSDELADHILLRPKDVGKSVTIKSKLDDYDVNRYVNVIMRSKDHRIELYDPESKSIETIDFSKDVIVGRKATEQAVREKILPVIKNRDEYYKDKIITWGNTGGEQDGYGRTDEETINTYFKAGGRHMFYPHVIKSLKALMKHTPSTRIMRYSELKDYLAGTPLAPAHNEALASLDPLIVIHHIDRTAGTMDASIIDLNFRGNIRHGIPETNLLINFGLSNADATREGIKIDNSYDNMRKLQLQMIAMQMKQAGANISGVSRAFMNKMTLRAESVDPLLYTKLIRKMGEIAPLSSDFSRIVSDITNNVSETPDYNLMLRNLLQSDIDSGRLSAKMTRMYESDIDTIDRYLNHEGNEQEYMEMLKARQRYLDSILPTFDERAANSEYVAIAEILGEMESGNFRDPFKKIDLRKDLGPTDFILNSLHDVQNEVLQDFYTIMRNNAAEINGYFYNNYKKEFTKWIDDLKPIWEEKFGPLFVKSTLSETFHKVFEPLILKQKVKGSDGKMYEVSLHKLRTEMDAEAKALNINPKEIEFTNWLADIIEERIKGVMKQDALKKSGSSYWNVNDKGERTLDTKALEAYVNEQYDTYWERGMLPVMYKTPNMNLFEGNFTKFIGKWARRGAANLEMFDELIELTSIAESTGSVRSHFENQFSFGVPTEFGSQHRMELLGLESDGEGGYRVKIKEEGDVDKTDGLAKNRDMNTNLEDLFDFFVSDALWKEHMENNVIPAYSAALVRLRAGELIYGHKQKHAEKHLNEIFKKVVQGRRSLEFEGPVWEKASRGLNILQKMTSFTGVAFSIPVGITSGIGNLTELSLHAFATSIGNPNNLFNAQEMFKGMNAMVKEYRKVNALTKMYQITEMERWDMVANQRYKETKNSPINYRAPQYLNWLTDYSVRQLVMVSQMIHDGTWEAHEFNPETGDIVYNAYKDKRYFTYKDGKFVQTDEQKGLMEWTRSNLIKDKRVFGQANSRLPLRAYDVQDQRRFEFISSHFVTGTYNQENTGMYDNYVMGRLLMQFHKYLQSKLELRFGGIANFNKKGVNKEKPEGGYKLVIKHADGHIERRRINFKHDGAYTDVAKWMYHDVLVPIFKGNTSDIIYKWKDLSELQKYSMARMVMDATVFFSYYTVFHGIGKMADLTAEQKKKYNGLINMRIVNAVKNGWLTALAMTPRQLMSSLNVPAIDNLKRLINLVTFNGTSRDLRMVLPFTGSVESFGDLINYLENQ